LASPRIAANGVVLSDAAASAAALDCCASLAMTAEGWSAYFEAVAHRE